MSMNTSLLRAIAFASFVTIALAPLACQRGASEEGESASSEASSEAMGGMHGEHAPDMAPGETRHFGADFDVERDVISLAEAVDSCVGTGDYCRIEAQLAAVCGMSGCWFTVRGEGVEDLVLVQMEGESFTIPENVAGASAIVEGQLTETTFEPSEAAWYIREENQNLGLERPAPEGQLTGYELIIRGAQITKPEA